MDTIQMWWLSFGFFAIVTVAFAILSALIIAAAKQINQHTANIWTVGKQIAGNTVSIWMLDQTNRLSRISGSLEEGDRRANGLEENFHQLAEPSGLRG